MFSTSKNRSFQALITSLRQLRYGSDRRIFDLENHLYSVPVQLRKNRQEVIELDGVYQDTMPDGGEKALVFALHGAPGSHADFKYLAPELKDSGIRMVMPNYPGFGYTKGDQRLSRENEERNEFAQAILDSLENITPGSHLFFLGHSRGAENALQMATSKQNIERVRGLVMLNAPGLRVHRGVKPFWKIDVTIRLLNLRVFNFLLHPFIYFVYNKVLGLKTPSGSVAAEALRPLRTFAYDGVLPCLEIINQNKQIRFLHAYSGSDFLIEPNISKEFASKMERRLELECSMPDSEEITRSTIEAFSNGFQTVSVNFIHEGHFLQKHRAKFIVDVIRVLCQI